MATSSITGGARAPHKPSGSDMASLGPSDNSDSGSDSLGAHHREQLLGDSDATGTGEASGGSGADLLPDHLLDARRRLADEASVPDEDGGATDEMALAFDLPDSALDDPELIDTTADVADLAQEPMEEEGEEGQEGQEVHEELRAADLNGFAPEPDRPARLRGWPSRGLQ